MSFKFFSLPMNWTAKFTVLTNRYLLSVAAYESAHRRDPDNCKRQREEMEAACDAVKKAIALKTEELGQL